MSVRRLRGPTLAVAPLLLAPDHHSGKLLLPKNTSVPLLSISSRRAEPAVPVPVWATPWSASGQISQTIDLLEHAGWVGHLSIVLAFSAWVYLSLPATMMEVAAGFLYGILGGSVCGLFCKLGGSVAAFITARYVGRRLGFQVPAALGGKLTALRTRPVLAMIGLRLAPLPLGVKNYGLGLSEVGLPQYLLASFIVDLPFSVLWASAGASCHSLADALSWGEGRPGSVAAVLPAVPLVALVLAGLGLCSICRRRAEQGVHTYIGMITVDD